MEEEIDWTDYESGPFCRHSSQLGDCDELCAACGHTCSEHWSDGCDHEGCLCMAWKEKDKPTS